MQIFSVLLFSSGEVSIFSSLTEALLLQRGLNDNSCDSAIFEVHVQEYGTSSTCFVFRAMTQIRSSSTETLIDIDAERGGEDTVGVDLPSSIPEECTLIRPPLQLGSSPGFKLKI